MEVLQTIQSWINENPHRKREVLPIEIQTFSDTQEGMEAPASSAGGLVPTPLEPPGPVSLLLWKTNAEYRAGTAQVRRTILRDTLLEIGTRVEKELKGVRWSRKKIQEQLAAQQTSAVSPPMDTPELDRALAHLFGYQKMIVDENGKKISFVPADPRQWSAEYPVWCATTGTRAVLHQQGEESILRGLARWLGDRESESWRVAWPEADGTLEQIRAEMTAQGVGVRNGLEKPKKSDWALALGRAQALRHFKSLEEAPAA
jgi:hypothetical protein